MHSLFAIGAILGWIAALWYATSKYLSSRKQKKKLDVWIWFFVWCAVMSFAEWPVFFGYQLIMKIQGVDVVL